MDANTFHFLSPASQAAEELAESIMDDITMTFETVRNGIGLNGYGVMAI